MRTFIVTGATSGLGLKTALHIASASEENRVILACRNLDKAKGVAATITAVTGNDNVLALTLDTSSLESVRSFVDSYKALELEPLFCLINNAAIGATNPAVKSADGYDLLFASNHLGHFLLTNLLIPCMDENGRVISVSSDMHNPPLPNFEWKGFDVLVDPTPDMLWPPLLYSYSKLLNLYFIHELADRLQEKGSKIVANAFNPGLMAETNLTENDPDMAHNVKYFAPERWGDYDKSPKALAEVAMGQRGGEVSGRFFDRSTNPVFTSELSYVKENAVDVWEKSVKLAKMANDEIIL